MRWPSWFNPVTWGIVLIWYFSNIGAISLCPPLALECHTQPSQILCGNMPSTSLLVPGRRRRHHAQ